LVAENQEANKTTFEKLNQSGTSEMTESSGLIIATANGRNIQPVPLPQRLKVNPQTNANNNTPSQPAQKSGLKSPITIRKTIQQSEKAEIQKSNTTKLNTNHPGGQTPETNNKAKKGKKHPQTIKRIKSLKA
jgi:hypothetical protein